LSKISDQTEFFERLNEVKAVAENVFRNRHPCEGHNGLKVQNEDAAPVSGHQASSDFNPSPEESALLLAPQPAIRLSQNTRRGRPKGDGKGSAGFNETQKAKTVADDSIGKSELVDEHAKPRKRARIHQGEKDPQPTRTTRAAAKVETKRKDKSRSPEPSVVQIGVPSGPKVCECGEVNHSYRALFPPPKANSPPKSHDGIDLPESNAEGHTFPKNWWVEELQLTKSDRNLIKNSSNSDGADLESQHISAASFLIRRLNRKMGGCDDQTRLHLDPSKSRFMEDRDGKALQIIHVPGHWQLLTRDGSSLSHYCSMGWGPSDETLRLIGHLMKLKESDRVEVAVKRCQLQTKNNCGLHAIAMAVCFAVGVEPGTARFSHSQLRTYLIDCFSNQNLFVFPPPKKDEKVELVGLNQRQIIRIPKLWHDLIPAADQEKKTKKFRF